MFRECFTLKLTELSIKPFTGLQTVNNRFSIERSSTYKSLIRSLRFCYSIGFVDWMQSHLHTNRHWFTTIVVDLILIKKIMANCFILIRSWMRCERCISMWKWLHVLCSIHMAFIVIIYDNFIHWNDNKTAMTTYDKSLYHTTMGTVVALRENEKKMCTDDRLIDYNSILD